jgi:sigma-B regulation protein RsbU (phosphoserine phosphatase)
VRSELAVPLIAKNRLIGVMDLESEQAGYFRPEHLRLLTLTASRIAQAIENARLYARVSRQAQTLDGAQRDRRRAGLDPRPRPAAGARRPTAAPPHRLPDVHHHAARREGRDAHHALRLALRPRARALRRLPITSGLVGAAVREWRLVNVPDVRKDRAMCP